MLDIYVKRVVINSFSPDNQTMDVSDQLLQITPELDEYFRKKMEKSFGPEARMGTLPKDNPVRKAIGKDLVATAKQLSERWLEIFKGTDDQKNNDLVFLRFDKEEDSFLAIFRMELENSLVHATKGEHGYIKTVNNNLPKASKVPEEVVVIDLRSGDYRLLSKRIGYLGEKVDYFADVFLELEDSKESLSSTIKAIEKTAQKIADNFNEQGFQFDSKLKTALHSNLSDGDAISLSDIGGKVFNNNEEARKKFLKELDESIPSRIDTEEIDTSSQLKKFETQKLKLDNGITLSVPTEMMLLQEVIKITENKDGTYTITLTGIEDISSK